MAHRGGAEKVDQGYLKLVKGDHFPRQTGGLPGQYETENAASFNFKGHPGQIRSELEAGKKEDLRRSHF